MKTFIRQLYLLPLLAVLFTSCQRELSAEGEEPPVPTYPVRFFFENFVDTEPLLANSQYLTPQGESYEVRTFKYYISNLELSNTATGKTSSAADFYHLVDNFKADSKNFEARFEAGTYDKIRFLIGVDSTRNVSGAQTGALDVSLGMFWTWNTGYVFAKLEGTSPAATTPNQEFTYHIGGFRTGESALRYVEFTIPAPGTLTVGSGANGQVAIMANVSTWFNRIHDLPIAGSSFIHSPGPAAMQYADNYSGMFTLLAAGNP